MTLDVIKIYRLIADSGMLISNDAETEFEPIVYVSETSSTDDYHEVTLEYAMKIMSELNSEDSSDDLIRE